MLIDGKKMASEIEASVRDSIAQLKGPAPFLAIVQVGDEIASSIYVKKKLAACKQAGMASHLYSLPRGISETALLSLIAELNSNSAIHGILIQLPLPSHIRPYPILAAVDPKKDIDGFHPINQGKLISGDPSGFAPCTPLGIQTLLYKTLGSLSGKNVVIVGRSVIVGKPLALLLLQNGEKANCTVTIAHSQTQNLIHHIEHADILIAAMGKPKFIQGDWIKRGAVVIDVGITRVENKIVGDVDFDAAYERAYAITPVPGGVGPMTIASLLENCLRARLQCGE